MGVSEGGKGEQERPREPARVTFRVSHVDDEGKTVVEEREVACTPDELVELLGRPWDTLKDPGPDEPGTGGAAARTAARQIAEALRFVVRERPEDDGGRSWTLSFEPEGENGTKEELARAKAPEGATEPTELEHTARVAIRGEEDGRGAELESGRNVLSVRNQAISITSLGNLYGILELELHVHIHPEGEGKP